MFDKDVTTLLLQIGTSSGGFEHPVLKCSSLPKNALEGGLKSPPPKAFFRGEIFLEFVKEMQIFGFDEKLMIREIGFNWNFLKHTELTATSKKKKWNNALVEICVTGGLPLEQ